MDHVINHRLTLREAGLRVQLDLIRYTVSSIAEHLFVNRADSVNKKSIAYCMYNINHFGI